MQTDVTQFYGGLYLYSARSRISCLLFLQICAVFSFHRRSAVITTPRRLMLVAELRVLPFSYKFWGTMFFVEKLKVMALHFASLSTILFSLVSAASMSRTL